MDVLLIGIAALSLILAIGMGMILFKVLREERRRSDARVAILAAAAAQYDLPLAAADPPPSSPEVVETRDDLFAGREASSPWPQRIGVAAAIAACIAIAGYVVLPAHTPSPPAAATSAPLELLSLRHTQEGNTLTVSGAVQNPRGGRPLSQVFATAILFAPDGSFLTSARAGLDFTSLAPGDQSPFVITVPVTGTVARYRIGFRAADGSVIAHIDRRADGTAAAHTDNAGGTPWAH